MMCQWCVTWVGQKFERCRVQVIKLNKMNPWRWGQLVNRHFENKIYCSLQIIPVITLYQVWSKLVETLASWKNLLVLPSLDCGPVPTEFGTAGESRIWTMHVIVTWYYVLDTCVSRVCHVSVSHGHVTCPSHGRWTCDGHLTDTWHGHVTDT